MRRNRVITLGLIVLLLAGMLTAAMPSWAVKLGGLLKGAAAVVLVDRFSGDVNKAINKLTANNGVGVQDRTKVVAILSVGQGTFAGAAQVSGPANLVDQVKAVGQLETRFGDFRLKALVPIKSEKNLKNMERVSGVGVSALVDVKL